MSIEAMAQCWGTDFPVEADGISKQTVRLVALAVADVVNDLHGYEFFGARRLLAEKVGVDADTVSDVMKHLCAAGVLTVARRLPGEPVVYRWDIGGGWRSSTATQRSSTAGGAVTAPQGGAVTAPLNTNETQSEPKSDSYESPHGGARNGRLFHLDPLEPLSNTETAKLAVNIFWDHVKQETGKPPRGTRHPALVKIVEPFVPHHTITDIGAALIAVRDAHRAINGQVLEEQLDGRANGVRPSRLDPDSPKGKAAAAAERARQREAAARQGTQT